MVPDAVAGARQSARGGKVAAHRARGCGRLFRFRRAGAEPQAGGQAGAGGPRRGRLRELRSKISRREDRHEFSRRAAHLSQGHRGARTIRALRRLRRTRAAHPGDLHARRETAALDDFYLDFAGTERLYPDYEAMLRRLQAEILGRTGLSVSVGAARTKVVASIASRLERPRGFRIVAPGIEESFLAPLPVDKLHGIGHTHAGALAERGISTIGQLRMVPKPVLVAAFGDVIGEQIWERARGLDGREVMLPSTPKSVSRETTIEGGTIDTEFLGGLLEYLSERIGSTLREYGKQAHTAGLRLRYVDHFSAHQTVRLMHPTNDERELLAATKELFAKLFTRRVAIRHVGVNVTNLDVDRRQNELFDTDANRRWYLNREVDKVRGRYGWNAVFYGKGLELREHYATKKNGLVLSTPCLSR